MKLGVPYKILTIVIKNAKISLDSKTRGNTTKIGGWKMEKFFTSIYALFLILAVGLTLGLNVVPEHLQQIAAAAGMLGLAYGMSSQVIMHYHIGRCGMHWSLNTIMLFAVILRTAYMVRTGQYWFAVTDGFALLALAAVQLQLAGYLLKKPVAS